MLFATFINFLCFNVIFVEIILRGGQRDILRLHRSCVSHVSLSCDDVGFVFWQQDIWSLNVESFIGWSAIYCCLTWMLIQIAKKLLHLDFDSKPTAGMALQILTPNHFLFYEPALSRCQINGTEMLRVNLSACFELKTRTASTTAIKRNTSWDGLLRFGAISQDQRVAKTNSL